MVDLSIIIVNYNNRKILQECLGSIFKNTRNISLEIIVVDNGSSDDSADMARMLYQNVNLIKNKENLGFVEANNQGLKIFRGRYACLLNNDTVVKDLALEKMVKYLDKNPSAGACSPKLLNTDGTVQHQGSIFQKKFWLSKDPIEIDFAIGACIIVRREVVDTVGILDENLFFYNEDLDWCIRIRKAGFKIMFIPDSEVIHYGGLSSKRVFNRMLFVKGFQGGLYFAKKHYGNIAYQAYRLILSLCLCLYIPFFIMSYPFKKQKFLDRLLAYFDVIRIAFFSDIPTP